jgi:hypothetical protein
MEQDQPNQDQFSASFSAYLKSPSFSLMNEIWDTKWLIEIGLPQHAPEKVSDYDHHYALLSELEDHLCECDPESQAVALGFGIIKVIHHHLDADFPGFRETAGKDAA